MIKQTEKQNWVTVYCDGGCGRSVTLRKKKVQKADYYLCNTKQDGYCCEKNIPSKPEGMVRVMIFNAAASFKGYRDEVPDEKTLAAIERAKDILRRAKCQNAIDRCFCNEVTEKEH